MPKISRQKPPKQVVPEKKPVCLMCGKKNEFYQSKMTLHKYYGKMPICKPCTIELFAEYYKRFQENERTVMEICKFLNLPFFKKVYETANGRLQEKGLDIISGYIATYNMTKINPTDTFADSDIFSYKTDKAEYVVRNEDEETVELEEPKEFSDPHYIAELKKMFGDFDKSKLIAMKRKFDEMGKDYPYQTSAMHREALISWVKIKTLAEFALQEGDPVSADKLMKLADAAAASAKLNPSQLSKGDLQGGLNTFSELYLSLEQENNILQILPQFKFQPLDALDFNIWCYINYVRGLQGLPLLDYEEVYEFYDKRVQEYMDKTGDPYKIFENDPTVKNRGKISNFIEGFKDDEITSYIADGGDDEDE